MSMNDEVLYIGFVLGHGGDALQMLDSATGIAATGRPTRIIVPALDTTVQFAERCRERGIPVERTDHLRANMYSSRQNLLHLIQLLHANRSSTIHFHTGNVCLPRTLLLALGMLRMPRAFVTVHGPYETMRPGSLSAHMWSAGVRRYMHQVFCPSRHSYEAQLSYGVPADRVRTVYNGIDVERFRSGHAEEAYRRLGLPANARLIVFSSRIDQQKRPLDAIAAFERVAKEFPDTHLVFVGTGDMEAKARERTRTPALQDRVHFVGYQNNVPDWLAAAATWLFPTDSENFSLAVLEALAAGCPIVSTECQGNDEVLVHEENAMVTKVGDIEAQAHQLRRLLGDDNLRQRISVKAARTGARFSMASVVQSYRAAYDAFTDPEIEILSNRVDISESRLPRETTMAAQSRETR
jgi:glycosyltransferase involved in cell wall biosynthesis